MSCNTYPELLAIQKGLDSICIGLDNKKVWEIADEASKYRIEIQQQLATANADLKALKGENELLRHKAAGHDTTMLLAELAAANARVAALEKDNARQKRLATISRLCKNVQACRAEKAEAQCAKLKEENSKLASAAVEQPPYKNDLLAQNKRIQTAINRYVIGNIELLDALKAALEEKP